MPERELIDVDESIINYAEVQQDRLLVRDARNDKNDNGNVAEEQSDGTGMPSDLGRVDRSIIESEM